MTQPDTTRDWYERRIDDCQQRLAVYARRDRRLERARLATFLPAIGLAGYGFFGSTVGWPWALAAAIFLAAFVVVVRVHERVLHDARELRERLAMNEIQLARHDIIFKWQNRRILVLA